MTMTNEQYKERLGNAFKALRKEGLIARQNFSCCGSCAGYELSEMAKSRENVKGYVFYTRQEDVKYKEVFLGYSAIDGRGMTDLDVALKILKALTGAGLGVWWDGSADTKIKATA